MTTAAPAGLERRRWTPEQKYRIVMDSLVAGTNVACVARNHDVNPNLIYAWRRLARKGVQRVEPRNDVKFVPVTIAPAGRVVPVSVGSAIADSRLEVVLRNGRLLRVPEGVAPSHVGALADALEGVEQ